MFNRQLALTTLAGSLIVATGMVSAADEVKTRAQDQTQDQTRTRLQDQIYGSQLMTEQERLEHRNRMRSFKTEEERNAYRLEHHNRMQERAKAKGVTLPDEPPMRGGPMGSGGMGSGGMGQGGMRPGGNR